MLEVVGPQLIPLHDIACIKASHSAAHSSAAAQGPASHSTAVQNHARDMHGTQKALQRQ